MFHEITKSAVQEAIKNPRPIDMKLVDAQQARRVLDRLVGYQISPLLWRKVRRGLSAGRVQSAALKIICDREKEIQAFEPEEYWTITAFFQKEMKWAAKLLKYKGKKLSIHNKEKADSVLDEIKRGIFVVDAVTEKEKAETGSSFYHQQSATRCLCETKLQYEKDYVRSPAALRRGGHQGKRNHRSCHLYPNGFRAYFRGSQGRSQRIYRGEVWKELHRKQYLLQQEEGYTRCPRGN